MLWLLACAHPPGGGAPSPGAWIAVEALPGEGLAGLPPTAGWTWSEREPLNALLVEEPASGALEVLGMQGARLEAGLGGYEGQHNPNLLVWGLSPSEAPALAAALGYVTRSTPCWWWGPAVGAAASAC
jgi:hypothetical protein